MDREWYRSGSPTNLRQGEADIFQTVLTVLENAFIEALRRGLEPVNGEDGAVSRRDGR